MGENNPIDACAFARILKTVQLFLENNNLEETSQCLLKEIEVKFQNSQFENVSPKGLVLRPEDAFAQKDSEIIISVGEKLNVNKQKSDLKSASPKCICVRNKNKNLDPSEEDLYNLSEVIRRLKEESKIDSSNGETFKTVNLTENGNQVGTLITHRVTEIIHLRHGYSCTCIQQPAESDDRTKGLEKSKSKETNTSSQKIQEASKQSKENISDKSGTSNEPLPPQVQEKQSIYDDANVKLLDEEKKKEKSFPLFKSQSKRESLIFEPSTTVVAPAAKEDLKVGNKKKSKSKENSAVQNIVSPQSKPSIQEVIPPVAVEEQVVANRVSQQTSHSPQKSLISNQEIESVAIAVQDLDTKSKDATISPSISQSPGKSLASHMETSSGSKILPEKSNEKSIVSGNSQEIAQSLQKSLVSNDKAVTTPLTAEDKEKVNSEKDVIKQRSSIQPVKSIQTDIGDDTKNRNKSEKNIKEKKSKKKTSTTVAATSVDDDLAIPNKSEQNIPDQNSKDNTLSKGSNKSQSVKKSVSINEIASVGEAVDKQQKVNNLENTSDKITSEKNSKEKTPPKGSEASTDKSQSLKKSVISYNEMASVGEAANEPQNVNNTSDKITSENNSKEKTSPKGSEASRDKSQSLKKSVISNNEMASVGEAATEPQNVNNTSDKITSEKNSKEKTPPKGSDASRDKSQSLKKSVISNNEMASVGEAAHESQEVNNTINTSDKMMSEQNSKEKTSKKGSEASPDKSQSLKKSVISINEIASVREAVHEPPMLNSSEKSSLKSKDKLLKSKSDSTNKSVPSVTNDDNISKHSIVAAHGRISKELPQIGEESAHKTPKNTTANSVEENVKSKTPTPATSVSKHSSEKDPDRVIIRAAEKLANSKQEEKSVPSASSSTLTADIIKQREAEKKIEKKGKKKRSLSCFSKPSIDSHTSLTEKKKKSKSEMKPENISDDQGILKESKSKTINDGKNRKVDADNNLGPLELSTSQVYSVSPNLKESQTATTEVVKEKEVEKKIDKKEKKRSSLSCYSKSTIDSHTSLTAVKDADHALDPLEVSTSQVYSVSPNLKESQTATTEAVKEKEVKKKIDKKEKKKSSLSCYSKSTIDSHTSLTAVKDADHAPNLKKSQTVNKSALKDNAIQTSFVVKLVDDGSNTALLDNIPNKDIPLATTPLDYDKVKEDLLNGSLDEKLALLQALRWRITKGNTQTRVRNLDSFTRYDLLGLEEIPIPSEQSILNSYLCSKNTPNALQEDMARFLNALASLAKGRAYLKNDTDFIINTLVPILMNQKEGVEIFDLTREFLLATVQKLSIDKDIRKKLISRGLLEWLVDYIIAKHNNMTNYEADYSTALLANLCLEDDARERCVAIKDKVVEMLFVLVDTPHECCLQYLNSILYSLLTKYYVNKLAMNKCLTSKLIDLHSKMKEPRKQKQLRDIIAIHTSVANEDVAFHKSHYPELVYVDHIEPELEMNDPVTQTPNGEELLRSYMLTGEKLYAAIKIMEESVRKSSTKRSKSSEGRKRKSDDESKQYGVNYSKQSMEQREMARNKGEAYNTHACTGRPTCCCRYCCYYSYCPPYRCYKEEQINTYSCECYNTIKDCSEEPSSASDAGATSASLFHNYCGYYQYYPYCPQ